MKENNNKKCKDKFNTIENDIGNVLAEHISSGQCFLRKELMKVIHKHILLNQNNK